MSAPDYAARAAAGAAFLDEQMPGWAERINLSRLDLSDECDCVLGQLNAGGYKGMRDELGLTPDEAVNFGFSMHISSDWEDWALLDTAWADEVRKRREPAQVTR